MARRKTQPLELAILNTITQYMQQLEDVWQRIGISDKQIRIRSDTVDLHVRELMQEMLNEEKNLEHKLQDNCVKFTKEVEALQSVLGIDECGDSEASRLFKAEANGSEKSVNSALLHKEKNLQVLLATLRDLQKNRKSHLNELRAAEKQLCEQLEVDCLFQLQHQDVPRDLSLRIIRNLEQRNHDLNIEYEKRTRQFTEVRSHILKILEQHTDLVANEFIQSLEKQSEPPFPLSIANLNKMRYFSNNMISIHKTATADKLRKDIISLRTKCGFHNLEIGGSKLALSDFQQEITDETIDGLIKEFNRLEKLLKNHFIQKIKEATNRLKLLQAQGFVAANVPKKGEIASADDLQKSNEDLEKTLSFTEKEIQKIEKELVKRKPVLIKLGNWQTHFDRIKELEISCNDPNRFRNRGGSLLNEEKERKQLKRHIVKIEKSVLDEVTTWLKENDMNGAQFLVHGVPMDKYFELQWHELDEMKTKVTEKRKLKRKKETEEEMRFGSLNPKKRANLSTIKRLKSSGKLGDDSVKRKLETTSGGYMTSWGEIRCAPVKSSLPKFATIPVRRKKLQANRSGPRSQVENSHLKSQILQSELDDGAKTTDSIKVGTKQNHAHQEKKNRRRSRSESDLLSLWTKHGNTKNQIGRELINYPLSYRTSTPCVPGLNSAVESTSQVQLPTVTECSYLSTAFSETLQNAPKNENTIALAAASRQDFERGLESSVSTLSAMRSSAIAEDH